MIKGNPPVALIAGPTASGKSALALALAERVNGVIINADSAQVYSGLSILIARPGPDDMARAEHRLFGTRDPAHPCSAADWAEEARGEVGEVLEQGRLPILVGGTGLYLRTLLDGIAPVPAIDPAVRTQVRTASAAENREQLRRFDPDAAARLHERDTARIARALEVVLSTGRPLAAWQADRQGGIGERISLRPIVLLPPRPWLYRRCDERFEAMMDTGAVEEVRRLLNRRLESSAPAMRAIGVPEIAAMLREEIGREEALRRGQQATRNYAKRQYTWFSHQPPAEWPRFADPLDGPTATQAALALLTPSG